MHFYTRKNWINSHKQENKPRWTSLFTWTLIQSYIQVQIGREERLVSALIKLQRKVQLLLQNIMLLVGIKISYYSNSILNFVMSKFLSFQKPYHKEIWQDWIALGNKYPLQAPNENICKMPSSNTNVLHSDTWNWVPKNLKLHYNQKVAPRARILTSATRAKKATRYQLREPEGGDYGVEDGGESGNTTLPYSTKP